MPHRSYSPCIPRYAHQPRDAAVLADIPDRLAPIMAMLLLIESFEDARSLMRLVTAADRVLVLAAIKGRLHYPKAALEAAVDSIEEQELVRVFGYTASNKMLGTEADV